MGKDNVIPFKVVKPPIYEVEEEVLEEIIMSSEVGEWTTKNPEQPGWYWFEDPHYGPAPVFIDWVGFRSDPKVRYLEFDMCVGGDQSLIGLKVKEINGFWCKIEKRPKR